MAKMVLLASYLAINSVDVSAYTSKIELSVEVDEKDVTTFASAGWKEVLGGVKSGSLSATFQQDVAASAIDSQMWALLGQVTTFEVRLANGARSTSNPGYTGSVLIKKWDPISGTVGDDAEVSVQYPTSGAVARQTS
ncbi:phage tail tube protein [Actinoplanes oblitus]|uniref:Phage tail tube protein n=1 Tax=Actinoplanes oblitus TaxID=3040509 RepID=A0ABY8WJ52_9ACTN|nr:phage tail tube protein [Actinoplanes oblitus]WIM97840.1 phage tail tube protein [Actinoplanes oblitus]